ncbi:TauD/TfdA family dioxygenase [Siccirubricoccus sp. KC 17139]|uniref:TauD/TfdA family dioxygenase n=1 Tax=Siccirubricoccus soli TaxID=2899147 RepID=A0ABT1D568_9PROT|nr:TauD/TfdA family dioxygenase [Siccirubricoccus soli]MCO6416354.1 TauD/TfdA family dioxygenase [Siccirubricoccus soli]MCP2682488.1 TauD/TfdA family dioxygenase [Siccirubricoccus soli]
MLAIEPSGQVLGATVHGLDLAQPLADADFVTLLQALGRHGVLRIPGQRIAPRHLRDFSRRFGPIQTGIADRFRDPEVPEVGILSNLVRDGKPIGLADAGQDWHTDMSYTATRGFVNVLYAVQVPRRDGRPLGATLFANTRAAARDLPAEVVRRLEGLTATHDFNVFWERMRRRPGSARAALTPEQRAKRPPARHPVLLPHPITGETVLYCNPGYAERIDGLDPAESASLLDYLIAHQLQAKYRYAHHWTEGDVLIWDHIGTLHNAIPDYRPDEPRLMLRCQVMAADVFDPGFQQRWLKAA